MKQYDLRAALHVDEEQLAREREVNAREIYTLLMKYVPLTDSQRSLKADSQYPRRGPRFEWRVCPSKGVSYRVCLVLADRCQRDGPGSDPGLVQHGELCPPNFKSSPRCSLLLIAERTRASTDNG